MEQARQLEALESAAQDVSSEAQLALLVAQNRSEQQRIQLREAKKLLDQQASENQRLQHELVAAINAIPNRHAEVCGQNCDSACKLNQLRMELQACRGALAAEQHHPPSELFKSPSSVDDQLSSFLRRAQEKRRKFKDMMKSASDDTSPSSGLSASMHAEKGGEQPGDQEPASTESWRPSAEGTANSTFVQSDASGKGLSPTQLPSLDPVSNGLNGGSPKHTASGKLRCSSSAAFEEVMTHPESEKLHPETRMILTLDTSMAAVGEEGSTKRAVFNIKLTGDLAKASGIKESFFKITSVAADSVGVVVDVKTDELGGHDPFAMSRELARQARDPDSVLRSGALTGKLTSLRLPSALPTESAAGRHATTSSNADRRNESLSGNKNGDCNPHESSTAGSKGESSKTAPDELQSKVTMLELKLAAKESELSRERTQGQFAVEEALSALQQRLEAKYTQLIWRQMQAHEEAVQSLLARLNLLDGNK